MNRRAAALLGIAILIIGFWSQYARPPDPDDEYMWCQTAPACAGHIERSYRAELDKGTVRFSGVWRTGTVVTVVYDLGSVRADFPGGQVEDGRSLEKWADEEIVAGFVKEACDENDHRDFIRMGGTMIHSYRFTDGEVLREIFINQCP
jgi:hypothetical protein